MASRSPRCITNGATTPRRFIDASKRSPRRVPLGETPSRTPPASGEAFSREPLLVQDQHEQSQEHNGACDTCYPILLPASAWKEKWDLVVMLLIVYSAVTVPVRVCFASDAEGWLWYFEVAMSFAFLFDLSLNFRMAYHRDGERGELVTGRREIAIRYLSGWFWIDAPSSLPVEVIELLLPDDVDTSNLALLRALRVFRLVRLLKLLKLDALLGRLEELLDVNLRIVKLVFLVVKMFFVAHLLACGWFYVATHSPGGESWLTTYDDGSAVDGPLSRQYLFSLYWAFTTLTTVGYGDITPTNDTERQFATVALLAGAFVFAYILGDISSLLATLDRQASLVEEKMDAVKEYLAWRGIPRELSMRVRRYYECVPRPMPGLCQAYAPPSSGVPSLVATFPLLVATLPPGNPRVLNSWRLATASQVLLHAARRIRRGDHPARPVHHPPRRSRPVHPARDHQEHPTVWACQARVPQRALPSSEAHVARARRERLPARRHVRDALLSGQGRGHHARWALCGRAAHAPTPSRGGGARERRYPHVRAKVLQQLLRAGGAARAAARDHRLGAHAVRAACDRQGVADRCLQARRRLDPSHLRSCGARIPREGPAPPLRDGAPHPRGRSGTP